MAQKFASELGDNGQVLIGCPVGTVLKPLLKSTILTTATARVKQDEYHIIMEYEKGEKYVDFSLHCRSKLEFTDYFINVENAFLKPEQQVPLEHVIGQL